MTGHLLEGWMAREPQNPVTRWLQKHYWAHPDRQRPFSEERLRSIASDSLRFSPWTPYERVLHAGGAFIDLVGQQFIELMDPAPLRTVRGRNIEAAYRRMGSLREAEGQPTQDAIEGLVFGARLLQAPPQYMFHVAKEDLSAAYLARNGSSVREVLVASRPPHIAIVLADEADRTIKVLSSRKGRVGPSLEEVLRDPYHIPEQVLRCEDDFPFEDWEEAYMHRPDIRAALRQALSLQDGSHAHGQAPKALSNNQVLYMGDTKRVST